MLERHFTARELSEAVGIRECTLAAWRLRKTSNAPRFVKLGRLVRYPESDVRRWLAEREAAAAAASAKRASSTTKAAG